MLKSKWCNHRVKATFFFCHYYIEWKSNNAGEARGQCWSESLKSRWIPGGSCGYTSGTKRKHFAALSSPRPCWRWLQRQPSCGSPQWCLSRNQHFSLWGDAPDSKVHGANMGPSGAGRTEVGPMLAPLTLLSGALCINRSVLLWTGCPLHETACIFIEPDYVSNSDPKHTHARTDVHMYHAIS